MATLNTTNIKHASSGSNNIVLAANGSVNIPTLTTNSSFGKILQVVQTVKKDKQTIQSTSLVDIAGMSVTITPSSASNKVLIRYCLSVFTGGQYWSMRLLRGSAVSYTHLTLPTICSV